MRHERAAIGFSFVVGAMDGLTGSSLILNPALTASLFGAALPAGDDVSMRFVGAFVLGVGLTYLWAIARRDSVKRMAGMRATWEATAIIRLVVALFLTGAILSARLSLAWLAVAATDATVAAVQILWLQTRKAA